MRCRFVAVNDKMQQGYRYALTVPAGRGFNPAFRPELTPKQMLKLGVSAANTSPIVAANFPRTGLRAPNSRPQVATVRLTISA
jgi:hypothetical protein